MTVVVPTMVYAAKQIFALRNLMVLRASLAGGNRGRSPGCVLSLRTFGAASVPYLTEGSQGSIGHLKMSMILNIGCYISMAAWYP
jgi:hypothetical protein